MLPAVIHGAWDKESRWLVKRSADNGRTWQDYPARAEGAWEGRNRLYGLQGVHPTSGSTLDGGFYGLLTHMSGPKRSEGVYPFDLLLLTIRPAGE